MIVYKYETHTYAGLFDWVGNVFHSIGHGISTAWHKVTSVFSSSKPRVSVTTYNPKTGVIKVGNTIGGGAYSVLEGSHGATLKVTTGGGKFGNTMSLFSRLLGNGKKNTGSTLKFSSPVFNPKTWTKGIFPSTTSHSPSINLSSISNSGNYTGNTTPILQSFIKSVKPLNIKPIGTNLHASSPSIGDIFKNALQTFATTATQTLIQAGQLKLQQSIYKELGLLPKQPAVVYRPVPVPATQQTYAQQPQPRPQPQPQPRPQYTPHPQPQPQKPNVVVITPTRPTTQQAGLFGGIPNKYLLIGGGLLLLVLLLNRD